LIDADLIRGHTDTIILAQLLLEDSYGYEINKTIRFITDERYELKEATLYTAFKRLEDSGFVHSYWGSEESGARRKYYRITPNGRAAYAEQVASWKEAKDVIDKLLTMGENAHA
jgi:DNA-binding PadR family transcriptional regulator